MPGLMKGVPLRMIFFPAGAALTGEGDCAVGVLCEDGTSQRDKMYDGIMVANSKADLIVQPYDIRTC